jgi:hypothetical protein
MGGSERPLPKPGSKSPSQPLPRIRPMCNSESGTYDVGETLDPDAHPLPVDCYQAAECDLNGILQWHMDEGIGLPSSDLKICRDNCPCPANVLTWRI